jgi:MarR family transcriptional repressor of emrRAB
MSFESRIDYFCTLRPGVPRDDILATRLLFRTARLLRQRINQSLAPFGLNMAQYLVLILLSTDRGTSSTPSALGEIMDVTRTQMTRILDGLETSHLIKRRTSGRDRRSLELDITKAGRQLLDEVVPVVHAAYSDAWSALEPKQRADTTGHLRTLHTRLESAQ